MHSDALTEFVRASTHVVAFAAVAVLWLTPTTGGSARAQTRDDSAAGFIGLGSRRGLTEGANVRTAPSPDGGDSSFQFSSHRICNRLHLSRHNALRTPTGDRRRH